jgi:hypothetical protein
MIYLTYFVALALSVVAEYYSIIGLATIFPGSFWPVVIMGGTLGAAKLVTVSWLYRNWKTAAWPIKTYLSSAVIILMLITSMGIFGYLSKAHMEHSVISAPVVDKVALMDEQIKTLKDNIDASRKELKQYDEIVDQTISRSTDEKGMANAQAIRRSQQKERSRILQEIGEQQKRLASIKEEYLPLSAELKKVEADVGPIKYIAALVYGTEAGADIIDKAVRLVILLIILVFDPLAILLLIAAQIKVPEQVDKPTEMLYNEPQPTGFVAQEIEGVLPDVVTSAEQAESYITQDDLNRMLIQSIQEMHDENHNVKPAYLEKPFVHFGDLKPMPAPTTEPEPKPKKVRKPRTVEVATDNVFILDEVTGETMPAISTKYDYDDNFAFREKENK